MCASWGARIKVTLRTRVFPFFARIMTLLLLWLGNQRRCHTVKTNVKRVVSSFFTLLWLFDADQLHSVPIAQMGNYQDFLKQCPLPLREADPDQPKRLHTFGNPFKLDKKVQPCFFNTHHATFGHGYLLMNTAQCFPTNKNHFVSLKNHIWQILQRLKDLSCTVYLNASSQPLQLT